MGLADRGYYGETDRGRGVAGMSFNSMLIIANIAIFVIDRIISQGKPDLVLQSFGYFSTFKLVYQLEFWRVLTFQFLHADVMHVAFNMFGLYVFGKMVEEYLGFKRYAAFYLVCGVFGAVMYLLLNLLGYVAAKQGFANLPLLISNSTTSPLIGASAGVFGVIMAAAYVAPRAMMQLLFPPVSIPLKVLAYIYVGMAVLNLIVQGANSGGDAAHLGGAIAGFFFVRNSHLLRDFFDVLGDSREEKKGRRKAGRAAKPDRNQAEVDRILAKVSAQGIQSLTDREKRTLAEASQRQQKAG